MHRIAISLAALLGVLASACDATVPVPTMRFSASGLPELSMPGARSGPAGQYGWTGRLGSRTGMHQVVQEAGTSRQVQLVFAVENDCFAGGAEDVPAPVIIAGVNARYVEAYSNFDPAVLFMPARQSGQRTSAYSLPVDDRTLCVYLTWDPTTTAAELSGARHVVDSIRGQANGANGIRIIFTLPEGWDSG